MEPTIKPPKAITSAQIAGIPIMPVLLAAAVGFSAGLAVSAALRLGDPPASSGPCPDCARRDKAASRRYGPAVYGAGVPADPPRPPETEWRDVFDQQTGQVTQRLVPKERRADAPGD